MSSSAPIRVLFLCTGNSARSILGEYLARQLAPHRLVTSSAGSNPTGRVHALAEEVLRDDYGIDTSDATSKSLASLSEQAFDLVITVCDHARDSCPVFPGTATAVHWGLPDPAAVTGSRENRLAAFRRTAEALRRALKALISQPIEGMEPEVLKERVGRIAPSPEEAEG